MHIVAANIASGGNGTLLPLMMVVLLGLRHAADPDHLTAVATLVASERRAPRAAGRLGLAWGLGHGATLLAFGMPVVLLGATLPAAVQQLAEAVVGACIALLGARLLVCWWREADAMRPQHEHQHAARRGALTAFALGSVHGIGGSAAAGLLVIAALGTRAQATFALLAFAAASAVAMGLLSAGLGLALVQRGIAQRLRFVLPAIGVLSFLFGVCYCVMALPVEAQ